LIGSRRINEKEYFGIWFASATENGDPNAFRKEMLGIIRKLSPTVYRSQSQRSIALEKLSRKFNLLAPLENPDQEEEYSCASSEPAPDAHSDRGGKHLDNSDLPAKRHPDREENKDSVPVAPWVPGLIGAAYQRMKENKEEATKNREAKLANPPAFPRLKALRDVILGMENEYGLVKKPTLRSIRGYRSMSSHQGWR
jgi:hypothetical protein